MKKWLLILGMITCMAGLTACGQSSSASETPLLSTEDAEAFAKENIDAINMVVLQGAQSQITDAVWVGAIDSWEAAAEDMGSYQEVISVTSDFEGADGIVDAVIRGSERDAVVEFVFEDAAITGVSVNVEYSFGETMQKAGLNTLLGMGTVFCVLILISLLISCFRFIPVLQAKFSKKPAAEEKKPVVSVPVQMTEEEDLTDDLELVAVIAAAVAASEGAATTDGFVVRSIRRAGSKWQKA